jgi:hypothetical protein
MTTRSRASHPPTQADAHRLLAIEKACEAARANLIAAAQLIRGDDGKECDSCGTFRFDSYDEHKMAESVKAAISRCEQVRDQAGDLARAA